MEAALYADKVAVDEETVRLRSHLAQMDTMLAGGGARGPEAGFPPPGDEPGGQHHRLQVPHDTASRPRTVVEIKAELEKIREQIQNVE